MYVLLICGVALAQQGPCILQADSVQFLCFDTFTPMDSTDDYFLVQFQVNGGAGNDTDSFSIYWPGVADYGHFAYGSNIVLNFPADSSSFVIYMRDLSDTACGDSIVVPVLLPCSVPCKFDLETKVEIHCNNATTVNITADDYYSVSFEIPSASTKKGYYVYLDGDSIGLFPYNHLNYFNHPADSLHHTIEFIDSYDPRCYYTTILGRFISCSRNCYIQQEYLAIACNNNDSPFDILDDVVEITAVINAYHNTDSFQLFINQILQTTAAYGDTLFFNLPFDGDSIFVTIQDVDKADCTQEFVWYLPEPCSIDCRQHPFPGVDIDSIWVLDCNHACKILTAAEVQGWQPSWTNTESGNTYLQDSLLVCTAGQYMVSYSHIETGCPGPSDTLQVIADKMVQKPLIESTLKNNNACDSAVYHLMARVESGQEFQWTGSFGTQTTADLWVTGPAQITLKTIHPRNGCSDSVSISLSGPIELPSLVLMPFDHLDCRKRETMLSLENTGAIQGLIFEWKTEGQNGSWHSGTSTLVHEEGSYRFRVSDNTRTCFRDTVVTVEDFSENLYPELSQVDALHCADDSIWIKLDAKDEKGNRLAPHTYQIQTNMKDSLWQNDAPQFLVTGEGKYWVNIKRTSDGCAGSDTLYIRATAAMDLKWEAIQSPCDEEKGGSILLTSESSLVNSWTLNKKQQLKPEVTSLGAGIYEVAGIDSAGCRHDTTLYLKSSRKLIVNTPDIIEIDYGTTMKIAAAVNRSESELQSYGWSPSEKVSCVQCMETWIEGTEDGTYTFAVSDTSGCTAEGTVEIRVKREIILTAPNIISDASVANSYFTIYGNENVIRVNHIYIYDRWGNLVWYTLNDCLNRPEAGWNGNFNGRPAVNGVYTYAAEVELYNGEKRKLTGDVSRFFQ